MVGLFVRLKLRLVAGSLKGTGGRRAGFVFSLIAGLLVAIVGFFFLGAPRILEPGMAADIGIIFYTAILTMWIAGPLLMFGLDDTLDPARLALFPLRTGQLARGLLASSAVGIWPIASLFAMTGVIFGVGRSVTGVLLGIVGVPIAFACCLVVSRLVTTGLSGVLRTRRGRDVLAVAVILVVVGTQVPGLLLNTGLNIGPEAIAGLADVLRWTPTGMVVHGIADGGLVGLAEVIAVALFTAGCAWLWIIALKAALVRPDASSQGGGSVRRSRFGGLLPEGVLGAVAAKELKYARRDPRGRVTWVSVLAIMIVMIISTRSNTDGGPTVWMGVFPVWLGGLVVALQATNSFGIDGRALWMNAVVYAKPEALRADLAGRQLAISVIGVPLLGVTAVVTGLLTRPEWILPAALTGWGVMGLVFSVGSFTSVYMAYTQPERINAFTGAAPGQGGQAFVSSIGSMVGGAALSLPVLIPVMSGFVWVSVLMPFYGFGLAWLARRKASEIGLRRMPELMADVSRPT
ncbi:hypothetical protein [Herbidospora mongoliensis]|uniref:hypothetical protein n=1 Tax=Herbidospora mongoliensis TaxID=688067 RepID=UPI00082FB0ED|nr:hypothetical protein [Herbidospora mongoliensis]